MEFTFLPGKDNSIFKRYVHRIMGKLTPSQKSEVLQMYRQQVETTSTLALKCIGV